MTPLNIALACVIAVLVAVLAVHVFYKGATDLTQHRKLWVELSNWLSTIKLPHAAAIMSDMAVGDVIGAVAEGEKLAAALRDPMLRGALLADHDWYAFTHMLADPNQLAKVKAAIQDIDAADRAAKGRALSQLRQDPTAAAPASPPALPQPVSNVAPAA